MLQLPVTAALLCVQSSEYKLHQFISNFIFLQFITAALVTLLYHSHLMN